MTGEKTDEGRPLDYLLRRTCSLVRVVIFLFSLYNHIGDHIARLKIKLYYWIRILLPAFFWLPSMLWSSIVTGNGSGSSEKLKEKLPIRLKQGLIKVTNIFKNTKNKRWKITKYTYIQGVPFITRYSPTAQAHMVVCLLKNLKVLIYVKLRTNFNRRNDSTSIIYISWSTNGRKARLLSKYKV